MTTNPTPTPVPTPPRPKFGPLTAHTAVNGPNFAEWGVEAVR